MRAFVSNVDSPVGRNISRVLSATLPGFTRAREDGDEAGVETAGGERQHDSAQKQLPYEVIGTLGSQPQTQGKGEPQATAEDSAGAAAGQGGEDTRASQSVAARKRAFAKDEAVEKFAVPGVKPKWVSEIIQHSAKEQLKDALLSSDVIIYDLLNSLEEAVWACEWLASNSEAVGEKPKAFIAISTIMTWARTKLDQDDPEANLMEDEYRRRKPHPNFKTHVLGEKSIVKFGKKGPLKTYVIGAGLLYHSGDSIFHHLFKAAWHCQDLTCYGDGTNILPMIHLDDLCTIAVHVGDSALSTATMESKYILAVDDSRNSYGEIVKVISEQLGTRKVKMAPKEEALLQTGLSQGDYDMLTVNLRLEPGFIKELPISWKYEAGMIERMPLLIAEYRNARGLTPVKIVIHGPPASGKTYYSKRLAEYYQIHHVVVEDVIKAAVARLELRAGGQLDDTEDEEDIDADRELLAEITEAAKANNGRYPDEYVINFVRQKLMSTPCRNQGYVLDGYPTTIDEASRLFSANMDENEAQGERSPLALDDVIAPEFVFSLECSDEFIKERVMSLPESEASGNRNSEEAITRRLEEFRANNTEENVVLNVFDEAEIFPIVINVEGDANVEKKKVDGDILLMA